MEMLDKFFHEILYRFDNWINEGSGWVIESVDKLCESISLFLVHYQQANILNCLVD